MQFSSKDAEATPGVVFGEFAGLEPLRTVWDVTSAIPSGICNRVEDRKQRDPTLSDSGWVQAVPSSGHTSVPLVPTEAVLGVYFRRNSWADPLGSRVTRLTRKHTWATVDRVAVHTKDLRRCRCVCVITRLAPLRIAPASARTPTQDLIGARLADGTDEYLVE